MLEQGAPQELEMFFVLVPLLFSVPHLVTVFEEVDLDGPEGRVFEACNTGLWNFRVLHMLGHRAG